MSAADELTAALAEECARHTVEAFARYNAEFRAITRRAPLRFDSRDLRASQQDAIERIGLYERFVNQTVAELRERLGSRSLERPLWRRIRGAFAARITEQPDPEFTKTFFSSISRRVFGTVGVAPDVEFVATDLDPLADIHTSVGTNTYLNHGSLSLLFEDLLGDLRFRSPWRDLDGSIAHVTAEVRSHLRSRGELAAVQKVEVIRPVFYQVSRAYVVGRIVGRGLLLPLVIALKNSESGVLVDAVMLAEDDVSIVFSFTRSYFHVDLERVAEAVVFLKSIMPRKPVSELFTVLGRARQGKTERYRELMRHLEHTGDLFEHAPGVRGLVMVCFTLPSFGVVFKVIRDRFPHPKTVLREEAERAVLDYGQCIRDLAYTNIFPGDLLLKNFGVTRHGRVIFYDYDELCRVTDCNFRDLPRAESHEDEMRAEPWFYVGESDVFPESFLSFLAFNDAQREALLRLHGEILTAGFWRAVQQRLAQGEVLEVLPYHPHRVRVAGSL